MELARKLRLKIGNSILSKKVEKTRRKVSYRNIKDVKKMCIVWDATEVNDFANLYRFCQRMNERNVDVKIIGYYPEKILPDQYTAIRYLSCMRREELSFFYLPDSSEAEEFIHTTFDILIDINFKNILPLKYITSLSCASLKVGLYENEKNSSEFDLMIEMQKPVDAGSYLDNTLQYLEMIHAEEAIKN